MAAAALDVQEVLRALSEPHRLELVRALRRSEQCVRELVEQSGLAQPLVSHHLAKLVACGLVTRRHADGFTHYALNPAGLAAARAALDAVLDVEALPASARPGGNDTCCRTAAQSTPHGGR